MNARILVFCVLLVLLTATVLPVAAAGAASCPGCGMVWKDSCVPFERNNETAYTEELIAAFAPVAANETPLADYSNRSWSGAFLSFHNLIRERYAFKEWRSVDFDALYAAYAPAISAAEKNQDRAAYYRALRGYLVAIPDGHVDVLDTEGDFGAKYADIGGGYGIALTRLDSGTVIVSYVANGSAAETAGIRPGDEVTGWNGKEIHEAMNATPYIWAVKKPSTAEAIQVQQARLLTRAPVGTPVTVKVTYGAVHHPRTLSLTAYDDGYDSLEKSTIFLGKQVNDIGAVNRLTDIQPQISNDTLTYRTLPGGYTYIAIYHESYEVYEPFKAAMLSAIANKSPGVVIDLRYNSGGDDNIASCFAGWFVDKPVFYEYATKYDPGSRRFTIVSEAWTQPQTSRYDGPVAVLVSPDTISSGEGLPNIFTRSGTGAIVSWYGTNGAFGMNNVQAVLPLGMYVFFPDGASLDQTGSIQVDSNASLTGGIAPTVRVPLNEDTLARAMAGEDVQLSYATQWLDGQQAPVATATTPAQKASPAVAAVILALGVLVVVKGRK
ncbi:MAG: S41 family peptidase [Methanoregula sp.]|jgi:carboxyl-terminal processing protease|uniref:S41 family peptidase n=1 Tax=Methanoregula sp. TaxID=2052170 RepID=UPI003C2487E9